MFYEPTALLKNMTAMLTGRQKERPEDLAIPGEQRHVCGRQENLRSLAYVCPLPQPW